MVRISKYRVNKVQWRECSVGERRVLIHNLAGVYVMSSNYKVLVTHQREITKDWKRVD